MSANLATPVGPAIAAHLPRPRGRDRYATASPEFESVRALYLAARAPLDARTAAAQAGCSVSAARGVAQQLVRAGLIYNVFEGDGVPAAYRPTRAPGRQAANAAPSRAATWMQESEPASPHYEGRELQPYTGRPGAMRAFELPSLVNGRSVPRVAPRLIAAQLERKA